MFVLANFINALAGLVGFFLKFMGLAIFIRAALSWVSPDPFNPIVQFVNRVTEPVLEPIRRLLPPMAVDISPMIAGAAIYFLYQFLVGSLMDLAVWLH